MKHKLYCLHIYPRTCTIANFFYFFFFSSRRRHTRCLSDWSSDVCSSDLISRSTVSPQLLHGCAETVDREMQRHLDRSWVDVRSEERRVGKECRSLGAPEQ